MLKAGGVIPRLNCFIVQPESHGATVDTRFVIGVPVGDSDLLLCHGTACVVRECVIGSFNSAKV